MPRLCCPPIARSATLAALLLAACLLTACGGVSLTGADAKSPSRPAAAYAISNGETLATATSHWQSNCNIALQLTGDSRLKYAIYESATPASKTIVSAVTRWSVGSNPEDLVVVQQSASALSFSLTSLGAINGSTSFSSFIAWVTITDSAGTQHIYSCPFTLQPGAMQ